MPGWWKCLWNDYLDSAVLCIVLFIHVLKSLVPELQGYEGTYRSPCAYLADTPWNSIVYLNPLAQNTEQKFQLFQYFPSGQCAKWQTCLTRGRWDSYSSWVWTSVPWHSCRWNTCMLPCFCSSAWLNRMATVLGVGGKGFCRRGTVGRGKCQFPLAALGQSQDSFPVSLEKHV